MQLSGNDIRKFKSKNEKEIVQYQLLTKGLWVDCAVTMTYADFKAGLKKIGAKTALYCDMGRGWNYCSVKEIFSIPGKYLTN